MLHNGCLVDPLNLREADVDLDSIVWSLSMLNRFTGHAHVPVSVLQHSILVALRVPDELKVYGLTHDFGEALFGDINRTVKEAFPEIGHAEKDALTVIWRALGIPYKTRPQLELVKKADDEALAIEATTFMHPAWRSKVPDRVNESERLFPMTPAECRRAFYALWREYGPGKVRVA